MGKSQQATKAVDVTELIRRVPPFEERLCVTFNGLFGSLNGSWLTLNGELQAFKAPQESLQVVLDVVDLKERLVATAKELISREGFCDFQTFSMNVQVPDTEIGYLRVYPKLY
jgi:hypothetical protein